LDLKKKKYSWVKGFWLLKCVDWKLGARHLPEVCWKGWLGSKGIAESKQKNLLPSFSGLHAGLCHQGPLRLVRVRTTVSPAHQKIAYPWSDGAKDNAMREEYIVHNICGN
jgi:hypothetical protein